MSLQFKQNNRIAVFACLSGMLATGCFDVVDKVEPATATETVGATPPGAIDQNNPPATADPASPPPFIIPAIPAPADEHSQPPPDDGDEPVPPPAVADQIDASDEGVADAPAEAEPGAPAPPVAGPAEPETAGDDGNSIPPVLDQDQPPAAGDTDTPPPVADEQEPPPGGADDTPPENDAPEPVAESPINRPPAISGVPATSVTEGDLWSFTPSAADPDNDTVSYSVANKPVWASFSTVTGVLAGVPQTGHAGVYRNIRISASDGHLSTPLPQFTVTVLQPESSNRAPTITGSPQTMTAAGEEYSFVPVAVDEDGDLLNFELANAPPWSDFDSQTGRLSGTPGADDEGVHGDIIISVHDGELTAALPGFDINVTVADENVAPNISGVPSSTTMAGQFYSFRPSASDPDGDSITFSILNLPGWATFDAGSGSISGTPGAADIGSYENIEITVSDGDLSTALSAFSLSVSQSSTGSATLSWTPPASNTDGSPLTDLTGYRIYFGTVSGNYTNEIQVDNPGITTYVIENLASATYYFATKSVNSQQIESEFSNEASKVIN